MAIKKVKYHPAGTGHADVNHFETDDTMVLMTAGGTLAAKIAASAADYVRNPAFGPATGAVNAYTFSAMATAALVDGMSVYLDNVIAANTGAATFNWSGLGAKAIVDAKGNALTAGKMPLNCIVGLRYNASISSFQLLGEGGDTLTGDMVAADLAAGKTGYSNNPLIKITGTAHVIADATPGTVPLYINPSVIDHQAESYTKTNDVKMLYGGIFRVSFSLSSTSGQEVIGQIYVNGVARGPAHVAQTYSPAYLTYSDDITVSANDNIQLYTRIYFYSYHVLSTNFKIAVAANPIFLGVL